MKRNSVQVSLLVLMFCFCVTPCLMAGVSLKDEVSGMWATAMDFGDCDNDGDLDLAYTGYDDSNNYARVYKNDGTGIFSISTVIADGVSDCSLAWGDYDNDGDLDLGCTGEPNAGGYNARIYRNDGCGTSFVNMGDIINIAYGTWSWGDYDNDGDLDIALSGCNSAETICYSRVYRNDGGINFSLFSSLYGSRDGGFVWGDYDNDGDLDLGMSGDSIGLYQTRVYRNDNGTDFVPRWSFDGAGYGNMSWGDYDNDGDLDFAVSGWLDDDLDQITRIYANNAGTFTLQHALTGLNESGLAWGDHDNDGDLDLATFGNTGASNITRVCRNDGAAFVERDLGLPGVKDGSFVWGDIDGDGFLDIGMSGQHTSTEFIGRIYRSTETITNTAPSPPPNIVGAYDYAAKALTISWDKGTDNGAGATPRNGLYYDIAMSTKTLATNPDTWIISPSTGMGVGSAYNQRFGTYPHGYRVASSTQCGCVLNALTHNTTYYYKIRTIDTGLKKSAWSPQYSLYFPLDVTAPPVPALGAPNGSTSTVTTQTFSWSPVTDTESGLLHYTMRVATTSNFTGTVYSSVTAATSAMLTLSDGLWYWTAKSSDVAGNGSAWAANRAIRIDETAPPVPTLGAPNGSTSTLTTQTFSWSPVTDAGSGLRNYTMRAATTSNFTGTVYSSVTAAASATLTLSDGLWYWTAKSSDVAGNGSAWAANRTIRIDGTAPSVPALLSPADGTASAVTAIAFDWGNSTDANGIRQYTMRASTAANFSGMTYSSVTVNSHAALTLPQGQWYWTVRSSDTTGLASAWAAPWTVIVDTTAPTVPGLLTPLNGSTSWLTAVTFDWDNSTDNNAPILYTVRASTTPDFSGTVFSSCTIASNATLTVDRGVWYWAAGSSDTAGNFSGWSSTRSVVVEGITFNARVPRSPSGIRIALADTVRTVRWSRILKGVDGSTYDNNQGYNIFRSADPLAGWAPVAFVAGDTDADCVWTDSSSVAGIYYYKVRGISTSNIESADSMICDTSLNIIAVADDLSALISMPPAVTSLLYKGAVYPEDVTITVTTLNEVPVSGALKMYEIRAVNAQTGEIVHSFRFPVAKAKVVYFHDGSNGAPSRTARSSLSVDIGKVSLAWYNGVEWIPASSTQDGSTLITYTGRLGTLLAMTSARATTFRLNSVYPKSFSPNHDHRNDHVEFLYENPKDAIVSGKIFDLYGAQVAELNKGLTQDCLVWDGSTTSGRTAEPGAYIFQIEVTGSESKVINGLVAVAR